MALGYCYTWRTYKLELSTRCQSPITFSRALEPPSVLATWGHFHSKCFVYVWCVWCERCFLALCSYLLSKFIFTHMKQKEDFHRPPHQREGVIIAGSQMRKHKPIQYCNTCVHNPALWRNPPRVPSLLGCTPGLRALLFSVLVFCIDAHGRWLSMCVEKNKKFKLQTATKRSRSWRIALFRLWGSWLAMWRAAGNTAQNTHLICSITIL